MLGARLVEAAAAVRAHVSEGSQLRLDRLMGSEIDALKLVSSMTLFEHVAKTLGGRKPAPHAAAMAAHAEAILTAAAAQGYDRCTYTLEHVRAGDSPSAPGTPPRRPPTP